MHPIFDMSKVIVIDALVVFFLGVVTALAKYWFGNKHSHMNYSIKDKVSRVLSFLLYIKS